MDSHKALQAARATVTGIQERIAAFTLEIDRDTPLREQAQAELTRLRGLERLGEASAQDVDTARVTLENLETRLGAAVGARDELNSRLTAAHHKVEGARAQFLAEAADLVTPEREKLKEELFNHATRLAWTMRQFARVDAIAGRMEVGTRLGASLLRALGEPFERIRQAQGVDIQVSLGREPPRLSEDEIVALVSSTATKQ
jgi:hypothetical protein